MPNQNRDYRVYFLGSSQDNTEVIDYVKVGRASHYTSRVRTLQTGNPHDLIELGIVPCESNDEMAEKESYYHDLFLAHRYNREWYHAVPRILRIIERDAISPSEYNIGGETTDNDDDSTAAAVAAVVIDESINDDITENGIINGDKLKAKLDTLDVNLYEFSDYLKDRDDIPNCSRSLPPTWWTKKHWRKPVNVEMYSAIREFIEMHEVKEDEQA